MTTLIEFIEARLSEDEQIARAIDDKQVDSGWSVTFNQYGLAETPPGWYLSPHIGLAYEEEGGRHIARHDPARVLREVAAKRRLLADFAESDCLSCSSPSGGNVLAAVVLGTLATAWSDHPDYDPAWSE